MAALERPVCQLQSVDEFHDRKAGSIISKKKYFPGFRRRIVGACPTEFFQSCRFTFSFVLLLHKKVDGKD